VDLAFNPPDGAKAIPFVVRVHRSGADQPSATGEAPADETPAASGSMEGPPK
jgi:hypothetical protein